MDFPYFDIIFFAMVAAFLVLRLRSVLGRRTGNERQRPDPFSRPDPQNRPQGEEDNVVTLHGRNGGAADDLPVSVATGLTHIQMADPSFMPDQFMEGAKAAFAMILEAYARGDKVALKPLLAGEVFTNFSRAIDSREQAGETMETEVVSFKSVDLEEARMDGADALVSVKFVTEQTNVTRDSEGVVIDGNPDMVEEVTDIWTFRRDTESDDPNWELVATQVPEE